MAKKRKASPKKPPKKPAAANASKSRAKSPTAKRSKPRTTARPAVNSRAKQFTSFEEAKSAAIDSLIQSIEEAEERLSAVKQAGSLAELQRAVKSPQG